MPFLSGKTIHIPIGMYYVVRTYMNESINKNFPLIRLF